MKKVILCMGILLLLFTCSIGAHAADIPYTGDYTIGIGVFVVICLGAGILIIILSKMKKR